MGPPVESSLAVEAEGTFTWDRGFDTQELWLGRGSEGTSTVGTPGLQSPFLPLLSILSLHSPSDLLWGPLEVVVDLLKLQVMTLALSRLVMAPRSEGL